VKFKDHT